MSFQTQLQVERQAVAQEGVNFDQELDAISRLDRYQIGHHHVEQINRSIAHLVRVISEKQSLDEQDIGTLRQIVQKVKKLDASIEEHSFNQGKSLFYHLAYLPRALGLYRATSKMNHDAMTCVLDRHVVRLANEKKMVLADGQFLLVKDKESEIQRRMSHVIEKLQGKAEGLCVASLVNDGDQFRLRVVRKGAQLSGSLRITECVIKTGRFYIEPQNRVKNRTKVDAKVGVQETEKYLTVEALLTHDFPQLRCFSLKKAIIEEFKAHFMRPMMPHTVKEAREWLRLLVNDRCKQCLSLFVDGARNDRLTIVIRDVEKPLDFWVEDDGTIMGQNSSFASIHDFENHYPVSLTYVKAMVAIEAEKPSLQQDIGRFMISFADTNFKLRQVKNCDDVEAELVKAGDKDVFIVWKALIYGMPDDQFGDAGGSVAFSFRNSKDGKISHYDVNWKDGTLFINDSNQSKPLEIYTFTTREALSAEAIYQAFQRKGFGVRLSIALEANAKKNLIERFRSAIYADTAALKAGESRLSRLLKECSDKDKAMTKKAWYAVTVEQRQSDESWQTMTFRKYSKSTSIFGSFFGKWKCIECVVSVDATGEYIYKNPKVAKKGEKLEQFIPFQVNDFLENAVSLKEL